MMGDLGLVAVLALATTVGLFVLLVWLRPGLTNWALEGEGARVRTLDGLRGILALSVVVHHGVLTQVLANHREWDSVASNLANQLGSCAVALFFMISAYLFCGGLIRNQGALNTVRLMEGRVMRILPLYAACVAMMLLFVAIETRFTLRVPPQELLNQVLRWLTFGFTRRGPVNGLQDSASLLGQVWTLKFEWMLYLLLPILAWAYRKARSPVAMYAGLILCCFIWPSFAFFIAGAAGSQLVRINGPRARVAWQVAGLAGLLIVLFGLHWSSDWRAALLLTPFFVAVLQAAPLFTPLATRPLRFLGEISYSVYLIHGFIIWAVSRWIVGLSAYAALGPTGLWTAITGAALATVVIAAFTFRFIERPFMGLRPVSRQRIGFGSSGLVRVAQRPGPGAPKD
jgi:peptidoglycan/LPS O-acetylase OafA/YrhL